MTEELYRSDQYKRQQELNTALSVMTAKNWNSPQLLVCGAPVCKLDDGEYVSSLGACNKCKDYQYYDEAYRGCQNDACSLNQIQLINGKCQDCPDYEYPDYTGRRCIIGTCGERGVLEVAGSCRACPPYERAQFNHDGVKDELEAGRKEVEKGLLELGFSEAETKDCVEKEDFAVCEKIEIKVFNSDRPAFQGEIDKFI